MKKRVPIITLSVVCAAVALAAVLYAVVNRASETDIPEQKITDFVTVQLTEKTSGNERSSYRVGADLPASDFSSTGQELTDRIKEEWDTYDGMTTEQRLISSKLWGIVGIQADTWAECEKAIGFTVYNPLESFDLLDKTGHFGSESADPDNPIPHVYATADTTRSADRKPYEISITAGYTAEKVSVTLTATMCAESGMYTTGSEYVGYAAFEQNTVTAKSEVPVLIVITNHTNNTGYYNADYYSSYAYWVRDNVFYALRTFGDKKDKAAIQSVLDAILEQI